MQSTKALLRSSAVASNYCRRLAQKQLKTTYHQCLCASRLLSTGDVFPPPHVEGMAKVYTPKIEKIVQDISQLTLLEVADLNELLKKTLNIQDAPVMAMGAVAAPAGKVEEEEEEEVAPRQEKMTFTVKMTKFDGPELYPILKLVRSLKPDMNMLQAKNFIEGCPQVVAADIPQDEAEKLKEALVNVGAEVEVE